MKMLSNLDGRSLWNVCYLKFLVDEASKGNKPSSTFKPSSITRIVNTINEKFGICCELDHVENHLKTVKSNWKMIQTIRDNNGFNWNDKLKMVITGKKEFDQYVLLIILITYSIRSFR